MVKFGLCRGIWDPFIGAAGTGRQGLLSSLLLLCFQLFLASGGHPKKRFFPLLFPRAGWETAPGGPSPRGTPSGSRAAAGSRERKVPVKTKAGVNPPRGRKLRLLHLLPAPKQQKILAQGTWRGDARGG